MTQLDLFATDRREKGPPAEDRERLSKQCAAILARLREGPASNHELATFALKYTSRISDLRKQGYDIDAEPKGQGVHLYTLKGA